MQCQRTSLYHQRGGSKGLPLPLRQSQGIPSGPWAQFCFSNLSTYYMEYLTAIEQVCSKLSTQETEECRADINGVLKCIHLSKHNISKLKGVLRQFKANKNRIILTADKGWPWFSWTKTLPIQGKEPLRTTQQYKHIPLDPTNKHKAKLINILREIKAETDMDDNTYRKIYIWAQRLQYQGL